MRSGDRAITPDGAETARLDIGEMGALGDTTSQLEGERIPVFGAIPGEQVVARVVRYGRRRRRVAAITLEATLPAPARTAAPCPYFGPCTGCQWQHVAYPAQLQFKRSAVQAHLSAYPALGGVVVGQVVAGPQLLGYRNHARFTVGSGGSLGFINRITRAFVRVDECMLMAPPINAALRLLQGRCGETTAVSVRCGVNTGELLVQPRLRNADVAVESGQTHYRERVLGHTFRVASPSFFQVNIPQMETMVGLVAARLGLTGVETLVDAYAGVGTFTVLLAPLAERVVAIEESAAAVMDATENARGLPNVEVRQGRTEDVLGDLSGDAAAVVLDPPRAGCHPAVLETLAQGRVRRVVYVGCDPEALARDVALLVGGGYGLESVEPVDMFPHTHHVECVATLSR